MNSTSWMKSRPHGHHHTSHVGLLPTSPCPTRGWHHTRKPCERVDIEKESNSTYHREMDSADHDQLPTAASTPRRPYGRSTNGRPRARKPSSSPREAPTRRRGRGNTSSRCWPLGPGDPTVVRLYTKWMVTHLKRCLHKHRARSCCLLAIILEMNGMQEGQRPGEHTWRQKHFPLTFTSTYLAQGDGSHAPPQSWVLPAEDTLSRQDWNHESQTERVLTDSSWDREQEGAVLNIEEESWPGNFSLFPLSERSAPLGSLLGWTSQVLVHPAWNHHK